MRLSALLVCLVAAAAGPVSAATYRFAPGDMVATFTYGRFGLPGPKGRVMGSGGTLIFDPAHPADSHVAVSLDMTTLRTGLAIFDTQALGPDYFDVAHFPDASFTSTGIVVTGANTAEVTGDLTLHGVTHPVVMAVSFSQTPALGFSGVTHIQRSAYGVGRRSPFIPDRIEVHIQAGAGH